ncbi:sulfatase-like hydrolase/transferase [uncultured Polaribacter sp.]|uniref:sulfatase family protein n=1 Tax=uncultured Polaribacter sp. TaxID=174711 RepID=UPI00260A32D5|nr:sulfatase-like hydrolase/transferase [uncultured Polaribacter sp.]
MNKPIISVCMIIITTFLLLSCNLKQKADTKSDNADNTPNVLVIMTDQLNPRVLGCYGGDVKTPNIDELAEDGAMFTAGYCSTPYCSPSRASLVTGKYTHNHGIASNCNFDQYGAGKPEMAAIGPDDITFDVILNKAGYATHHYGKWHLANTPMDSVPNRSYYPYPDMYNIDVQYTEELTERFKEVQKLPREDYMFWQGWYLPVEQTDEFKNAIQPVVENNQTERAQEYFGKIGKLLLDESETFEYRIADKTIDRLNECAKDGKKFSITASFNVPHDPNVAPDPYYSQIDFNKLKLAENSARDPYFNGSWSARVVDQMGDAGLKEFMRVYYANVMMIDAQIGRIMKALEDSGQKDNTIVIFTADHGDMSSAHRMVWKSTGAFYDEVAAIPYIISYPNAIPANKKYNFPANIIDFMPTILSFTGQKIPEDVDGVDLAPFLTGEKPLSEAPQYTICERIPFDRSTRGYVIDDISRAQLMIRDRQYKYSLYRNGYEMLFDMTNDSGELDNLAKNPKYASIKEKLKTQMLKMANK